MQNYCKPQVLEGTLKEYLNVVWAFGKTNSPILLLCPPKIYFWSKSVLKLRILASPKTLPSHKLGEETAPLASLLLREISKVVLTK